MIQVKGSAARLRPWVRRQKLLALPPGTSVIEADRHMRERGVGAVLATEEAARLVGIFTGRDVVGRVLAEGKDAATTTLAEVMTPDPRTWPQAAPPSRLCG